MGTLMLSELREEVRDSLAGRTDITDAQYNRAINLSQTRMARRHDFFELSLRVTGVLTFTGTKTTDQVVAFTVFTSKTIDDVISFILHDGASKERKLKGWTPRQLDEKVPNPALESVGFPEAYVKWADQFELFRVPDQQYNFIFRAYVRPDTLTSDTATSDLDDKDDLIIFLSVAYLFGRLGEYDRANRFFGIFKDEMNQSISDDIDNPDRDIKPRHLGDDVTLDQYWNNPFIKRVG